MPSVGLVGLAGNLLSVAVLSGQVGKILIISNYVLLVINNWFIIKNE